MNKFIACCIYQANTCLNANNCWLFNIYKQDKFHAELLLHVLYYGPGNDVIVLHDGVHCTAIASSEKGGISRLILNIE